MNIPEGATKYDMVWYTQAAKAGMVVSISIPQEFDGEQQTPLDKKWPEYQNIIPKKLK